jgi:uncharacterized protein YkwD
VQKQGKWIVAAVGAWALMLTGSIGLLGMAFNWWGGDPPASAADLSALRSQPSPTTSATEDETVDPATPTVTPTPTPTPTPTATPTRPPAPKPEKTTRQPAPEPKDTDEPDPAPKPKRTSKPGPSGPTSQEAAYENEVVQYTNAARREAGCGPVRVDDELRTAARRHSYDMAANHYFSHTGRNGSSPWDRMRSAGYNSPAAENIAKGQSDARRVMAAWLMSEGHRNNILNCQIRAIGVGVRLGGDGPYWTQDFGYR